MSAATGRVLSMNPPTETNGRGTRPACPSAGDGRRTACPHAAVKRVKLGEVCEEVRDRIPSAKVAVDDYVTTDNMVKDRGGVVAAEYVPEDVGLVNYKPGDVLIANIRPYLKKIWLANKEGGCSSDVVVLRSANNDLSPEYLHSVLCQDAFFDYVMLKPRGTKMPRGDRDWMKQFEFPLPPLTVQREIVARLEKELKAVEKAEAAFKSLAETAEAEFKAELGETFESGIYQEVPLSEVASFSGGSQPPKSKFIYEPKDGYVRLYQIRDYNGDPKPTYIPISDARKTSKVGDIMIGRYGASIGLIFWGADGAYNVALVKVNIIRDDVAAEYLFYALNSERVQRIFLSASRNAQAGFNEGEWNKMIIPLPDFPTQHSIVARLDAARSRCEKLKAAAGRGMAFAADMRKAILKEAFE